MTQATSQSARGIRNITVFVLILAAILYGLDQAVNVGLRKLDTSAFGVSHRIMTGQANADIVISGSSRALTHYDSRIIQQVTGHTTFNIGRNGSQTDMQVAFLKAYLKHNSKPKLIIHNLDLFSFLTSHEIYDPAQYLPYLREESIYAGIQRVYPDAWKWKYLPLYSYLVEDMRFTWIRGLKGIVGLREKEDHYQGFLPRFSPWTGDFEKFKASNPDGVKFAIEPQGVSDLKEIVTLCRDQGIPLLFVYSPEYSEMQSIEANRGEIFALFHEICRPDRVPLWDYSGSPISQSRQNFYNSQHLNAEGAGLFSADLAKRLAESDLLTQGTRQ